MLNVRITIRAYWAKPALGRVSKEACALPVLWEQIRALRVPKAWVNVWSAYQDVHEL